jgi:hypothetical protein
LPALQVLAPVRERELVPEPALVVAEEEEA